MSYLTGMEIFNICLILIMLNLHGRNLQTGKITRLCFRENKPACFAQLFPDAAADTFYTDSLNDRPMMLFAENSFLVKGERVIPIDKTSL